MVIYFANLILVTFFSILAVRYSEIKYLKFLEKQKKVPNFLFVSFIILCLMSVYSLRWFVGTDFRNYYDFYFYYGNMNITDIIGARDWGFYSIASIMYKILPENFIAYNFVLAALTYIPVIITFRKYSTNFTFSIILYITMMHFYGGFNGVRQAIAISLCFSAYPLLQKDKFFSYSLIILVAYLFHSTSLLMIPLIFFVTRKSWSRPIILTLLIIIISIFILPNIWSYLIIFLDYIGQEKLANDYNQFDDGDDGINILRILVGMVPVIMAFFFYKNLKINNSQIDIIINMSLLYLVFLLFGSQMTVLARLSDYFGIYNTLLIPELANIFKRKDKQIFIALTILLFLIYMLLLLPVDSNLLPYEFNLNNVRE